jgi:hypothetical protein
MKKMLCAFVMMFAAHGAGAQSFDEVFSKAQTAVGEIGKFQQALQNPDLRLQYTMVQEMLKHPDPAIQRLAKEHALFSTNPVMREAAVKAILDSGATLRVQIAGTSGDFENTQNWVRYFGGTFVETRGEALIPVPTAVNDSCWGTTDRCIFRQVSSTIQYNPYIPNWRNPLRAVLNLGNDGILRGFFTDSSDTLQVQIDLKE